MLKKSLLICFGVALCFPIYAQKAVDPGHENVTGRGWISGRILDKSDQKTLEYATVSLYQSKDSSLVGGTITNKRGDFKMDKLPVGDYFLKVDFMGYCTLKKEPLKITAQNPGSHLGQLFLERDHKQLQEVTVKGDKDYARFEIDKISYAVSKSPLSESGSISEVLSTIPMVSVNADGRISLRGSSNVKILIDGRVSGLLGSSPEDVISQLPANSVDRVEVITNPSARYDASGGAGIVNIIMKKNRTKGYNGTAMVKVGTRDKYIGSTSMDYRVGKFNLYGAYDFRDDHVDKDYDVERDFTSSDNKSFRLEQNNDRTIHTVQHVGRIGLDFLPDEFNTIGYSLRRQVSDQDKNIRNDYRFIDMMSSAFPELTTRLGVVDGEQNSWVHNLTYLRTFDRKGQSLSMDAAYTKSNALYLGNYWNADGLPLSEDVMDSGREEFVFQADYVHPVKEHGTFEMGYLGSIKNTDLRNESERLRYDEDIHGMYLMYSGTKNKFGYQFGLRGELTDVKTSGDFKSDYFDLFPSVNFSLDLPEDHQLQLSYSRKIYRPNLTMINGFMNQTDPNNLQGGNSELEPEYIQMVELNHIKKWDKVTFATSLFGKRINDAIQRIRLVEDGVGVILPLNLKYRQYLGLDFNVSAKPFRWWKLNTYLSGRWDDYKAPKNLGLRDNDDPYWFAKVVSTFYLPKNFAIQATMAYEDENPILQGKYSNLFFMDMVIQKSFFKKRAALTLTLNDLFGTYKYERYTTGANFHQKDDSHYENQVAYLSFRYNFGKRYRIDRTKKKDFNASHSERDF